MEEALYRIRIPSSRSAPTPIPTPEESKQKVIEILEKYIQLHQSQLNNEQQAKNQHHLFKHPIDDKNNKNIDNKLKLSVAIKFKDVVEGKKSTSLTKEEEAIMYKDNQLILFSHLTADFGTNKLYNEPEYVDYDQRRVTSKRN